MNTIVCEMNPAEEIELTDAQLAAVYGACSKEEERQFKCEEEKHFREHFREVEEKSFQSVVIIRKSSRERECEQENDDRKFEVDC